MSNFTASWLRICCCRINVLTNCTVHIFSGGCTYCMSVRMQIVPLYLSAFRLADAPTPCLASDLVLAVQSSLVSPKSSLVMCI